MNDKQLREHASKLPTLTAAYWIIKITATTLGETGGDLMSMTMEVGYGMSTLILMSAFLISVVAQLMAKKHHPWLYWTAILTSSTAGTTMSDWMDRTLGLGYLTGSLVLIALLCAILAYWRFLTPHSMSVTHVSEIRIERLYWIAILFSNTLGTALGDYLADDSGMGFAGIATILAGSLTAILAAYYLTSISRVALFWIAFVQTRPFGATLGDTFTKSPAQGGLGFGTIGTSAVLIAVTVIGVAYVTRLGYGGSTEKGDATGGNRSQMSPMAKLAMRMLVVAGLAASVVIATGVFGGRGKQDIPLSGAQTYKLQTSGKMKVFPSAAADSAQDSQPIHRLHVKHKNDGATSSTPGCWTCTDCICNSADCACTECTSC